ncbi:hypothetical protein [Agrobacterium tumefaciens]|uniref:hypothetical protein n=1 Tax=Agrobacterium tumefaciens TaxID=358 RepID=UPI0015861101|nr:hypothetical protein [Agrobacterium tumefaciens]
MKLADGLHCKLYSYSPATAQRKQRWHEDGGQRHFYGTAEAARQAVLHLKREVKRDPEHVWKPMHLEKIEIDAPTTDVLLVLLNQGISTLVKRYEIIGTIANDDEDEDEDEDENVQTTARDTRSVCETSRSREQG